MIWKWKRNKFPQDKKSEHVKCRKTSIIILSSTRKIHLDKAKSMLSGIPALHSSFIQQSTKFSAYIIVIGNKILNKDPYIIIIANSVQSTWVKHNPHLVFQKTTDKTCSLIFWHGTVQTKGFGPWHPNSQSAEGGVQWGLSTGLPCPSVRLLSEPSCCYQRPLTLAMSEWYWRGSRPLAPPSRNEARMLDGSNSFLRFLFSSEGPSTPTETSRQKFIAMLWSEPNTASV